MTGDNTVGVPEITGPYQVMPPLTLEEYQALETSIREHGVLTPVVTDESGDIIDGYHRDEIGTRLGVKVPRRTVRDLTDEQKTAMALTLNLDRRHLTREQRRELLAQSIKAEPELSDSQHAKRTGTSDKTATSVRTELEGRAEIPSVDKRTDTAGRKQPAKKAPAERAPELKAERRRRPLRDRYHAARYALERTVRDLENIHKDDRFARNRNSIRDHCLYALKRQREGLDKIIAELEP
jgi:ParB-like chromosome segregation protein Spo0J